MPLIRPPTKDADFFIQTDDIFVPRIPGFCAYPSDPSNLLFAENNDRNVVVKRIGKKTTGNMGYFAMQRNKDYAEYIKSQDAELKHMNFIQVQKNKNRDIHFYEYLGRIDKTKEDGIYTMHVIVIYFAGGNDDIYRLIVGSPMYKNQRPEDAISVYDAKIVDIVRVAEAFIFPLTRMTAPVETPTP